MLRFLFSCFSGRLHGKRIFTQTPWWSDSPRSVATSTSNNRRFPYLPAQIVPDLSKIRLIGVSGGSYFSSGISSSVGSQRHNEFLWTELNKKFAVTDGLNDEWKLIYFNIAAENRLWFVWPGFMFIAFSCTCVIVFLLISVLLHISVGRISSGDIASTAGVFALTTFGIYLSTRWTRVIAFRIYQRQKGGRNARIDDERNKREYCVIWYNLLRQRKKFFYNHTETSGANEWRSRFLLPNFYARKRGWYVSSSGFMNSKDYFAVRVNDDGEGK